MRNFSRSNSRGTRPKAFSTASWTRSSRGLYSAYKFSLRYFSMSRRLTISFTTGARIGRPVIRLTSSRTASAVELSAEDSFCDADGGEADLLWPGGHDRGRESNAKSEKDARTPRNKKLRRAGIRRLKLGVRIIFGLAPPPDLDGGTGLNLGD